MKYPKTREGLIKLIISQLIKVDTTYVSFCREMELTNDKKVLDDYCNNLCQIHKRHVSHQLFCLPLSCKRVLEKVT